MVFFSFDNSVKYLRLFVPCLIRNAIHQFFWSAPSFKRSMFRISARSITGFFSGWMKRGRFHGPKVLQLIHDTRCKASCSGCIFRSYYNRDSYLTHNELSVLFDDALSLGIQNLYVLGADPFYTHDKGIKLMKLLQKQANQRFFLFTEGTSVPDEAIITIARSGNIIPIVSLDGFNTESDTRKHAGSHEEILHLLVRFREHRIIYGISTMLTEANAGYIIDGSYYESLRLYRPAFLALLPYTQTTKDIQSNQEIIATQRIEVFHSSIKFMSLKGSYPVFDLLGMESFITSCPAAQYSIAVFHDGTVTPCFAIPAGVSSIRESPLSEILKNDTFLSAIRKHRMYEIKAGRKPRCLVLDNPAKLEEILRHSKPSSIASYFPDILKETHHE